MMESWHVVGQKVVYVDGVEDDRCIGDVRFDPLSEGEVYTIAVVEIVYGDVAFQVKEWSDPRLYWCASRFRPVFPEALEELRSLLTPTPGRIRELESA